MDAKIQEKLQELFVNYTKNLPGKIKKIENHWQELAKQWNSNNFRNFHREVHSLCGSSGTYGYITLSRVLRELEVYLKSLLGTESITEEQKQRVTILINQIKLTPLLIEEKITAAITEEDLEPKKIVYVLDEDKKFVLELSDNLKSIGYDSEAFSNFSEFEEKLENALPIAMVVDAKFLQKDRENYLKRFQKLDMPIPLFGVAESGDLLTRLRVTRSGGRAFFQKPVETFYLTQSINQICGSSTSDPLRILVVDDSQSLADYYSLVLQQAGMEARAVTNPLYVLDVLMDFRPDLILLDVYMPDCSGLELAAVLRQEKLYAGIPIIFLSTEDDRIKQLAALSLGGDDFLTKPILPHHLVAAVRSRAERAGILASYMTRDSLTGLLNHTNILQHLDVELKRAARDGTHFCFMMIDIDHFKSVNDTYGHQVGDRVLRKLSELLLTRLREIDFVGRYGGEEFAVILPNTNSEVVFLLADQLREQFSKIVFKAGNAEFKVTFSIGIANYPMFPDAKSLIEAADLALYRAKNQGRNRVVESLR